MKPICVPCERFFRPKQNGVAFVEGMPLRPRVLRGKRESESWKPYKLWSGDLWECPDCGTQTIIGVGQNPIGEHFQEDFEANIRITGATLIVKDC